MKNSTYEQLEGNDDLVLPTNKLCSQTKLYISTTKRARRISLNTLGSSMVAGRTTSSFLAKSAKAFRIVLPERVRGKPVVNLGGLRLCLKPIHVAVTADPVSVCHQLLSTGTLKVFSIQPFVSRSQCSPAMNIERKDFKEYFLPHLQSGSGIILPGSTPQFAAIITLGFACSMRVQSSLAAKPPNTTECMAPRRAVANIAIIASAHPKILRDFPKICDNSPCKWDREHRQFKPIDYKEDVIVKLLWTRMREKHVEIRNREAWRSSLA
uniref:Uncharacterized protein n=1 Tax=Glossina austeni TaxID=7395 RepID=A0A1A9V1W9_GLOAU